MTEQTLEKTGAEMIKVWLEKSREPAQLVLDKYGEPHEATDSALTWHGVGPWKRIVAQKAWWQHDFPAAWRCPSSRPSSPPPLHSR